MLETVFDCTLYRTGSIPYNVNKCDIMCDKNVILYLKFYNFTPSPAVADEHGKRHTTRAHLPEAVSDWLNPLSLGPCQPPVTLII